MAEERTLSPKERQLRNLEQQLKDFKAAPLWSEEEKKQRLKGLKGQDQYDKARAEIKENQDAHERSLKQREKISDQINTLASEVTNEQRDEQTRQRQAEREAQSNPVYDKYIPAGLGAVAGGVYGELTNQGLNAYERGNTKALAEIARELGPTNKLTGSQLNRSRAAGAAKAAEKFMPSSPVRQGLATVGRAASYGIPAALIYREYNTYQERANDPNATFEERQADQRIANGLLGVLTGIGVEGGRRFFFPHREKGLGEASMRIATARDFAERMDKADAARMAPAATPANPAPASPAPKSVAPGSRADLLEQAKRYRIPGRSSMNADQLREKVAEAIKAGPPAKKVSAGTATKLLRSPALAALAAGGMAYSSMTSDAEAASGEITGEDRNEALKGAAAAGGTAAATGYGLNKIISAIPAVAQKALSAGAGMATPFMAADAYDPTPEQLAMDRNTFVRNMPRALYSWTGGELENAYQKAQVPERSPVNSGPRVDRDPNYAPPMPAQPQDGFESTLSEFEQFLASGNVSP